MKLITSLFILSFLSYFLIDLEKAERHHLSPIGQYVKKNPSGYAWLTVLQEYLLAFITQKTFTLNEGTRTPMYQIAKIGLLKKHVMSTLNVLNR